MDVEGVIVWFILAGIALSPVALGLFIWAEYDTKDIRGWYEQAYSAADAEQMAYYLDNLSKAMGEKGMTKGHYALIFKNAHNDVALDLQVFKALRDRCLEVAKKYDKGSVDYAMTLQDIRNQMDKTDFSPVKWWLCNKFHGLPLVIIIYSAISVLLGAIVLPIIYY